MRTKSRSLRLSDEDVDELRNVIAPMFGVKSMTKGILAMKRFFLTLKKYGESKKQSARKKGTDRKG